MLLQLNAFVFLVFVAVCTARLETARFVRTPVMLVRPSLLVATLSDFVFTPVVVLLVVVVSILNATYV